MPLLRDQKEKDFLTKYSSFSTVEKTLGEIVELLLKNDRLKRLLYYTDKSALKLPALNPSQSLSLINNQIRIVPKVEVDRDAKPFIILTFDNFVPDEDNPRAFRNCTLGVDIIVPYQFWILEDFKLRPYSIAGEIDAMLNRSALTKLGMADFAGAKMLLINSESGGLTLYYNLETSKDDVKLYPKE